MRPYPDPGDSATTDYNGDFTPFNIIGIDIRHSLRTLQ
jgi:hypothetical protein